MDQLTAGGGLFSDFGTVFVLFATLVSFILPMVIIFPPIPPRRSDALLETHTKVGPPPARSNPKSTVPRGRGLQSGTPAEIQNLWIYPVKSCKGIEVSKAKVLPTGLEFDRLFTFAQLKSPFPVRLGSSDEEKSQHRWEFVTQRQFPLLATVEAELWQPDVEKAKKRDFRPGESFIILRFPWRDDGIRGSLSWLGAKLARGLGGRPEKEILLPVEFPSEEEIRERDYSYEDVTVWRETVGALNMSAELPEELQLYLGVSNKLGLFRVDPARLREVYRCAPSRSEAGYQPVTGFQDAYPLHIINVNSVNDLDSKLEKDENLKQLDARRFRANINITGAPAYDEDSWKAVRFRPAEGSTVTEESTFHVSCRTVRCKMPNVDPDTGFRHPVEPDKSLRARRDIDAGAPKMGCLGMQMTPLFARTDGRPEDMEIVLDLGMTMEVLERGPHRYIKQ